MSNLYVSVWVVVDVAPHCMCGGQKQPEEWVSLPHIHVCSGPVLRWLGLDSKYQIY